MIIMRKRKNDKNQWKYVCKVFMYDDEYVSFVQ